jgi:hypothetical protein
MNRTAILFLASGCIGSITGGDGDPPKPTPEPATEVTLRVRDGSVPQANVKVIFQGPDDSVIADTVTDAAGAVTAKMPNGGNLSVIRTFGPNIYGEPGPIDHVYTYVGVKPGDSIELTGALRDDTTVLTKITVGLEAGAQIGVMTPCGSTQGTSPVIEIALKGCGPETDFLIIDYSGDPEVEGGGGPLYFTAHAKVGPTIDFTVEQFRGTLTTELTAANAQMTVVLQKRLVLGGFTVFDTGQIPAYTPTITTDVPELVNTEQLVSAWIYENDRSYVISARDYFTPTATTIDVSQLAVPMSANPQLGGYTLSWTEAGSGTPDVAIASLTVGAVGRQFVRTIAAPYSTGGSIRIPPLPVVHDRYNLQSTDTPSIVHSLARANGGYDVLRPYVFNGTYADIAPMGRTVAASQPATSQR